jgi:hypothetical protein
MRCPACPVPADRDCRAAAVSPNACKLVVREAGRRDGIAGGFWTDKVLLASGSEPVTHRDASVTHRRRIGDASVTHAARPTARQSLDRLAIVKRCEHRTPRGHCGCEGIAACALGKGRGGQVSIQECLECVAERGGAGCHPRGAAPAPSCPGN